jgi:hypothetical protein
MSDSNEDTLFDRNIKWLKNHKLLAGLGTAGFTVILLASFTDAVERLARFGVNLLRPPDDGLVAEYCDLLTPLVVQFDRTLDAFQRWRPRDLALEQTIVDGNTKARTILETQTVPLGMDEDRRRLIQHYDRWLEEYVRVRQLEADSLEAFIFVGPKGFPFPRDAERRFRHRRASLVRLLGADVVCRE